MQYNIDRFYFMVEKLTKKWNSSKMVKLLFFSSLCFTLNSSRSFISCSLSNWCFNITLIFLLTFNRLISFPPEFKRIEFTSWDFWIYNFFSFRFGKLNRSKNRVNLVHRFFIMLNSEFAISSLFSFWNLISWVIDGCVQQISRRT